MSPTGLVPDCSAWKSRPIRSGACFAFTSGRVSECRLRRVVPRMSRSRMTRPMRLRFTRRPRRRSSAWMRGTP